MGQLSGWKRERDDIVRGACGGFLFGIPLLYTMEVWWIGAWIGPPRLLVALVLTFGVVFLLNRTAGFRSTRDVRVEDALRDSVEAIALGTICSLLMLVLLREITPQTALGEALGKVVFEGVPFTMGVALANLLLRTDSDEGTSQDPDQDNQDALNVTLADLGFTAIGAVFIAFNIAPTDEIPMLAAATSPPWLLLIVLASLLISYGIVFEADFADQKKRARQQGLFQQPLSETVFSYLVSLAIAAAMLWFFDRLAFDDPWQLWLSHTLLLGLPATIGGAAGRLVV
ncbi:TIGR02587 family membrane protein [Gloeobacter morelensis]|uniref:TIGR02587 family membrane protein n=1 Tax=Gloeobacter morelensis MG652769 TaxID=2781736 RepID=A0ABY3PHJ3_9CYAN|nr:TIGR02587 family membrane protein [Gloeobacter morelensis]UFP93054.1 TIGR02587 family membrane protein [Gloeobacter morelensis MG652769]